jgi:hypothetical protein
MGEGKWELIDSSNSWKAGDLIFQQRAPGGECLVVKVFNHRKDYDQEASRLLWSDMDWPLLRVLHPTEGLIDDPSYYYSDIK